MGRKTILSLAAVWEIPEGIVKLTLTLTKEIYSPLMMLVIFGGMFVTAATAQTSLQTKILATAAQPTADEVTQKRIEELIKRLGNENASTRRRAARNLGKIADLKTAQSFIGEAVQPLIKLLKDRSSEVRNAAARALGQIGDPQAVQPLTKALEDKNEGVRSTATYSLGQIDPPAVQPLIKALEDEKESVRRNAAIALGGIGPHAVKPLIKALGDENGDVRQFAALALGRIGDSRAVQPLIKALGDENARVRQYAASALGEISDPQAVQPLIKALGDEAARRAAVRALGQIGDPQAVQPLIKALGDEEGEVRQSAAEALGQIGDPRAVQALIKALGDEDRNVRFSTVRSLGQIGDPRAVQPLINALKVKASLTVYTNTTEALGKIGPPAVQPLIKALGDENARVRQYAASALGEIGDPQAVQPLIKAFGDSKWQVRLNAASALGKIGKPAVQSLIKALGDEEGEVRRLAARALGRIDDPRAVQPLIKALGDENARVRRLADGVLGRLGDPGAVQHLRKDLEEKKMTIESAVKVMRGIEPNRLSREEMDKKEKELGEAWKYLIAKGEKSAIYLKSELNKLRQKEEKDDHFALGAASILWQIRGIKEANTIAQIWETADQLVNYRYVFMTAFMAARERNPKVIPMLKATLREKQGTFMTTHAMNLVWPLTQEWIWGTYGSLGLPELEKVLLKSNIPAELESAIYILSNAQYVKVLPRVRELINHKNDDVKTRALTSLGIYGHPDDYNTLIKALSSKNLSVIKGSLGGLMKYQNIDAAPLISPFLNHNDKEISYIAVLALSDLPCIDSLDAIYKYSNTTSDSMIEDKCQSIIRRYLRKFKTNWREYSKKDVEEKKKLFDDYWEEYEEKYKRKLFDRKLSRKEFLKAVKEWKRNHRITGGKYEWVEDRHILDIATPDDINLLIDVQAHILERLSDEALYEIVRLRTIITRLGRRRYARATGRNPAWAWLALLGVFGVVALGLLRGLSDRSKEDSSTPNVIVRQERTPSSESSGDVDHNSIDD